MLKIGVAILIGITALLAGCTTLQPRLPAGTVIVEFCVEPDGSVSHPSVVKSNPPGRYDAAALKTISQWKFYPRRISGVPVRTCDVTQEIRFDSDARRANNQPSH